VDHYDCWLTGIQEEHIDLILVHFLCTGLGVGWFLIFGISWPGSKPGTISEKFKCMRVRSLSWKPDVWLDLIYRIDLHCQILVRVHRWWAHFVRVEGLGQESVKLPKWVSYVANWYPAFIFLHQLQRTPLYMNCSRATFCTRHNERAYQRRGRKPVRNEVCNPIPTSINDISLSRLSSRALEALADFYSERDLEKRFEDLRSAADGQRGEAMVSMKAFAEDWNASQFWVWCT
jgi:hypothetical protein